MLTCPLAPRRNHTTLESHNTMSKCSHLCQHERGYQIRPATLTSPSIFLQNLIPAWIAEEGFPPTIWQMLLPSSRTTSAALLPASICFSAPIISTSLYFLFAMSSPPHIHRPCYQGRKSYPSVRGKWGEGHSNRRRRRLQRWRW